MRAGVGYTGRHGSSAPPTRNAEAVERGARLFQQHCTQCHGRDGRAEPDVIADATNLTLPADY